VRGSGSLDPAWPLQGLALLTDPTQLADADGGQNTPEIVPDGHGGAIVAWQDDRSPLTGTDIFAQHVLASGTVDPNWKANGAAVVDVEGLQHDMVIASDGVGGAFVVWTDTRPGVTVSDIFAQHILDTGVLDPRWPADGLPVCTAAGPQNLPEIVADGAGGAFVSWDDGRSTVTGFDVFAQHLLASGAPDRAWPVNGLVVCAAPGDQGRSIITSDGGSGAIVAWTDGRVVGTDHIFAEHLLVAGRVDPAWPVNGRQVSNVFAIESRPRIVPDDAGGVIVNWMALTGSVASGTLNMFAQHVKANGVLDPAWPAGGRALSQADRLQTAAEMSSDGAGGAFIAWEDLNDVVVGHVLASGVLDPGFALGGRRVCGLESTQGDPAVVATPGGGAIVAWSDTRNLATTSPDIFALQIETVSALDAPPPMTPATTLARPRPNPARDPLALHFALAHEGRVRLAIYDVTGRPVRELATGVRPAGEQTVTWDLRDATGHRVDAGVYFARVELDGRLLSQRLAILR
jgi:hypothetical protein